MSTQTLPLRRTAVRRAADQWEWTGEPTIVVAGARTGAGASTIASLVAVSCAADGRRTLLIDAHDANPSLHRLLAIETDRTIVELQVPSVDVASLLVPVTPDCMLLPCAPRAFPRGVQFGTAERRSVFRRVAQIYGDFDVVVIDGGAKLDGVIACAGRGPWRFVVVGATDPLSLASAYAIVKAVDTRWPGVPVEFLVNCDTEENARAGFDQVRAGTQHFLSRDVGFAGVIPTDGAVADAAQTGLPLHSLLDQCVAGASAKRTTVRLLAELDDASNDS